MATNEPTDIIVNQAEREKETEEHWGPQRITRGRRDVITAFVRRPLDSSILLVKRSEKVNTYKLHWGGVSGVVEGGENLQQRAEREIFEEVGYASDQLHFIRSGRPLYVDDKFGKLFFAVHPFLFELTPNASDIPPKLNWENVDAQFMSPETLKTLEPMVPQLTDTFDRVLLNTPHQEHFITKIKKDREHGAAQLAVWILDALQKELQHCKCSIQTKKTETSKDDGVLVLEHLRNYGYHIATCRPSMAPLATAVARVLSSLHQSLHNTTTRPSTATKNGTVEEICLLASKAVEKERENLKSRNDRLLTHALELLHDTVTIMTISKSSSVSGVVNAALNQGKRLRMIVCESRPLCEGVVAAQDFIENGASEVTVITEAQASIFMKHADMVLIGADAVDLENGVYNKAGTHLLALAAREVKVPVYALADSSKISPGPLEKLAHPGENVSEDLGEEKDPEEVTRGWFSGGGDDKKSVSVSENFLKIKVRNVYFEATPLELLTAVVTEDGLMDAEAIKEGIKRVKELYIEAFQLQI